jgi:YHS domain-containing protein
MSVIDPVCGAEVSADSAYAIEAYGPLAYHFCSQDCHQRFLANPADFVSQDPGETDHAFTTQDQANMPQQWRDDGDLEGPPTKR